MAWFVRFLMLLTAPITWPIGARRCARWRLGAVLRVLPAGRRAAGPARRAPGRVGAVAALGRARLQPASRLLKWSACGLAPSPAHTRHLCTGRLPGWVPSCRPGSLGGQPPVAPAVSRRAPPTPVLAGRLLDWVLGEESALFKRRELKALVSIHAEPEVRLGAPAGREEGAGAGGRGREQSSRPRCRFTPSRR